MDRFIFFFFFALTISGMHSYIHRYCHIGKCVMFEPNQVKWTMSVASGLPCVSACRDLCDLILGARTLPLIAGCNQWLVCWRCWASLQQMKRAIIYIIPSDYSVFFSFCLCCIQSHHRVVSLSPSDGPGGAVAVGDECRQSQLLLWFTQSLPRHHHHFIRTLTVHNQTSGDQHDCQRQASR